MKYYWCNPSRRKISKKKLQNEAAGAPRPSSSMMTRLRWVALRRMAAVSSISAINVDTPRA